MGGEKAHEFVSGDGSAVADIDALGDGGGFRKIRRALERIRNVGAEGPVHVAVGDKDGYVENDGHPLPSERAS